MSAGSSWSGTSNRARFPGAAATSGGQSGACVLGLRLRLGSEALGTYGTRAGLSPFHLVVDYLRTHDLFSEPGQQSTGDFSLLPFRMPGLLPSLCASSARRLDRPSPLVTPFPALLEKELAIPSPRQPLLLSLRSTPLTDTFPQTLSRFSLPFHFHHLPHL